MYASIIEFIALVFLIGGFWYASRVEGRAFAQQWFVAGYLAAVTREILNQVMFQVYIFAPAFLRIGVAPAIVTVLGAGVAYVAYAFAKRFVDPKQVALFTGLIFLITASFALPIEATAAQLRWWSYTTSPFTLFGGVPIMAPFVWGIGAAIFYAFFWRISQTRLRDQGKLYAMITLSPIIAVVQLLFAILLGA